MFRGSDAVRCVVLLSLWHLPNFNPPIAAQEAERSTRQIQAARTGGEITLDGALNEPSWTAAQIARGFIQNDPREGEPATYDTEVRVIYDDDALYFGGGVLGESGK